MRATEVHREALHQERLPGDCPHDGRIREGRRGLCGVRLNAGTLYALNHDSIANPRR